MANFCGNCGRPLEDNAVCTYCNNTLNNQNNNVVMNTSSPKKKVRFHWEIPLIPWILWTLVTLIKTTVGAIISSRSCEIACEPSAFETTFLSIINVVSAFSTILCVFSIPSLIVVIIVYIVQKGKKN